MKPKIPVKAANTWWCENCQSKEMTQPEMVEHLRTVHGFEPKGVKVQKTMTMHVDCADSYSTNYEVTIPTEKGEIKLTNATCYPRHKNDQMRYERHRPFHCAKKSLAKSSVHH